jgi:hypothetical protein
MVCTKMSNQIKFLNFSISEGELCGSFASKKLKFDKDLQIPLYLQKRQKSNSKSNRINSSSIAKGSVGALRARTTSGYARVDKKLFKKALLSRAFKSVAFIRNKKLLVKK